MEKSNSHSNTFARVIFIVFGGLLTGFLLFAAAVDAYQTGFRDRIYRGVSVDNVLVGGLTRQQAAEISARNRTSAFADWKTASFWR